MNVKCAACGFLALRKESTRDLVSAEKGFRKTGELPGKMKRPEGLKTNIPTAFVGVMEYYYEQIPICFVEAADFEDELVDGWGTQDRLACITKDRSCGKFCEWTQGLSPKEHLELIQQRELIELQAKLERKRDARMRKWRKEDVALAKEAMRVTIRSYIVGAVIGAVGVLASVALTKWLG